MIKNIKWLLLVSLTFVACNNDDETIVVSNSSDGAPLTSGTADFSNYVALGNSLTSGYSDGALFIEGQKGAYPNILAQQFALVGGGEFKIPFMNDNLGGLLFGGATNPKFGTRLYFDGAGPVSVSGTPSTEVFAPHSGSYNNMGVPGAKSYHLLFDGYGNPSNLSLGLANPYFVRFATAPNKSILQDAMAQLPTFFSLWIGNNDVLGYATAGGVTTAQDPEFGGDITPSAGAPGIGFDGTYTAIINTLTSAGAKGVVANIPYVTSVPFFTTVVPNQIPGLAPSQVTDLNQLFGGINAALTSAGLPKRFSTLIADDGNPATAESNPLLIVDETLINISAQITTVLTPKFGPQDAAFLGNQYGRARHARSTAGDRDYILLTAASLIRPTPLGNNIEPELPAGLTPTFAARGVTFPLQDASVLTADETAQVKTATDAYNATIKSLADSKGLAFVDANSALNDVATKGVSANGFTLSSTYVTGGAFSLDGVHPSPRGYALIANEFIKAINAKYGSNLKGVDLGNYRILFPANPLAF